MANNFSHQYYSNILEDDGQRSVFFPKDYHHPDHSLIFHGYNDHVSVANNLHIPPPAHPSISMLHDAAKKANNTIDFLEKQRKDKQLSPFLNQPHQSKDTSNIILKKQKKQKKLTSDYDEEERKKKNITKKVSSSSCLKEERGVGYVHVRARRGQATDSHSLAERARREKISERMKLLQSIVPGCDKVTGKALMLDEIINYVRSLQNQVELLSMKLVSVNPMLYNFGVDLDAFMVKPNEDMVLPSVPHRSPNGGAATFAPTNDDNHHHLLAQLNIDGGLEATNSPSFPQPIILSQGNGYWLRDVDEEISQKVDNHLAVCSNFVSHY